MYISKFKLKKALMTERLSSKLKKIGRILKEAPKSATHPTFDSSQSLSENREGVVAERKKRAALTQMLEEQTTINEGLREENDSLQEQQRALLFLLQEKDRQLFLLNKREEQAEEGVLEFRSGVGIIASIALKRFRISFNQIKIAVIIQEKEQIEQQLQHLAQESEKEKRLMAFQQFEMAIQHFSKYIESIRKRKLAQGFEVLIASASLNSFRHSAGARQIMQRLSLSLYKHFSTLCTVSLLQNENPGDLQEERLQAGCWILMQFCHHRIFRHFQYIEKFRKIEIEKSFIQEERLQAGCRMLRQFCHHRIFRHFQYIEKFRKIEIEKSFIQEERLQAGYRMLRQFCCHRIFRNFQYIEKFRKIEIEKNLIKDSPIQEILEEEIIESTSKKRPTMNEKLALLIRYMFISKMKTHLNQCKLVVESRQENKIQLEKISFIYKKLLLLSNFTSICESHLKSQKVRALMKMRNYAFKSESVANKFYHLLNNFAVRAQNNKEALNNAFLKWKMLSHKSSKNEFVASQKIKDFLKKQLKIKFWVFKENSYIQFHCRNQSLSKLRAFIKSKILSQYRELFVRSLENVVLQQHFIYEQQLETANTAIESLRGQVKQVNENSEDRAVQESEKTQRVTEEMQSSLSYYEIQVSNLNKSKVELQQTNQKLQRDKEVLLSQLKEYEMTASGKPKSQDLTQSIRDKSASRYEEVILELNKLTSEKVHLNTKLIEKDEEIVRLVKAKRELQQNTYCY